MRASTILTALALIAAVSGPLNRVGYELGLTNIATNGNVITATKGGRA